MSTYDEPVIKDNSVYWKLTDTRSSASILRMHPDPDKVNIQMPWNFDVSYKLNGVSVKAEDCAGANGLVEIIPFTRCRTATQATTTKTI